ncbi:TnpV protein [Fusicatenibacter saccharivorans]|uniref:TnpV protein n=1 Tax=Fusicatenibacter saccharivorans TaxID=1150298 RepID=UPI003F8B040E
MELNFIKCGDYYIPDIKLKNPNIRLGKWGRMRREYLRLANPALFSEMVLSETLYEHCAEIEETARSRMIIILPQLMEYYGVTEQLKAENQLEWVRQMNACVAQAEEAIKTELIYC